MSARLGSAEVDDDDAPVSFFRLDLTRTGRRPRKLHVGPLILTGVLLTAPNLLDDEGRQHQALLSRCSAGMRRQKNDSHDPGEQAAYVPRL